MNHYERKGRSKLSVEKDFEFYLFERVGDGNDMILTGSVPRLISKGKRKGEKTWDKKNDKTVVVTEEEAGQQFLEYEKKTGKCGRCFGKGEVFKSWNHKKGTAYMPCRKCNGTGSSAKNILNSNNGDPQ